MEKKNDSITPRNVDFAKWYTDVCRKAELMDYSSVKGFIDYLPYGYSLWESIRAYMDKQFKAIGTENVYLPLVIPASLFNKEKEHVEGFAPECLVATMGGNNRLADPLIVRPTSEVLFSDLYKRLVSSYRDLPKIYNQWCSVVRWEKTTRPFLRGAEFLWQEGHCLFETEEEARKNALDVLQIYDRTGRDLLAVPFLKGRKSAHERFAGAHDTYSIEALMYDGKALQSGTTHYLGTGFAKAFGIKYLGRKNTLENPHQTSWGVSTRLIGSVIMVHGDDNGLVLPPAIAPVQVVIIPIKQDAAGVLPKCREILEQLTKMGVRAKLDDNNLKTPGWKFAEYEVKGVPLRLEVGPRDLERGEMVLARRVDGVKKTAKIEEIENEIPSMLEDIHKSMYLKAKAFLDSRIHQAHSLEEVKSILDAGGIAVCALSGDVEDEDELKSLTQGGTVRCIKEDQDVGDATCVVSGKKAAYYAYVAKAY